MKQGKMTFKKKNKKEGKIILFNYQWKSKPKSWRKRFFFFLQMSKYLKHFFFLIKLNILRVVEYFHNKT